MLAYNPGCISSLGLRCLESSGLDVERFFFPLGVIEEVLYMLHLSHCTHVIKWFYVTEMKLNSIVFSVSLDIFQARVL